METAVQIQQATNDLMQLYTYMSDNPATKVGALSTLEGILGTVAKTGQIINKDLLTIRADNDIDVAIGDQLDTLAIKMGVTERISASNSNTKVFVVATEGTAYLAASHKFISNSGITFDIVEDVTVTNLGFAYVSIISQDKGSDKNVAARSITQCSPAPAGHKSCWNEFKAISGSDKESDIDFRNRIKRTIDVMSIGTLSQYLAIFQKINNRVLNVFKGGKNSTTGQRILYLLSTDGQVFDSTEKTDLVTQSNEFLTLTEQESGLELLDVSFLTIDISMKLDIKAGADVNQVLAEMQNYFQKKYDFRYVKEGSVISRIDLILMAQKTQNVNLVYSNDFLVNGYTLDIVLPNLTFPRFRSFILYDKNGDVILNNNNNTSTQYQIFYQSMLNSEFQKLLKNI